MIIHEMYLRTCNLFFLSLLTLITVGISVLTVEIRNIYEVSSRVLANESIFPVLINTWGFIEAGTKAWQVLSVGNGSALDAVEQGCSLCEEMQCDGTVGYGGSPDENGETTLDAMIMDGVTHAIGAVGALREVKDAISVARKVMEHTSHTFLVGSQATEFALQVGFPQSNLTTASSIQQYTTWLDNDCQPNSWQNVTPDPTTSCGPYTPMEINSRISSSIKRKHKNKTKPGDEWSHDTIGMVAIDRNGNMAAGTSTNGMSHKIPGRVGDSPIPGSGAYVDQVVGGAAATGDGDIMMRFLPSFLTVEKMRSGMSPAEAAAESLNRIVEKVPSFSGAIVALSIEGEYGAACYGLPSDFNYVVANSDTNAAIVESVPCIQKSVMK